MYDLANLIPLQVEIQSNWWLDVFLPPFMTGLLVWAITFGTTKSLERRKTTETEKARVSIIYHRSLGLLNTHIMIYKILNGLIEKMNVNEAATFNMFELSHVELSDLEYADILFMEGLHKKDKKTESFQAIYYRYRIAKQTFLYNFKELTELSKEFNSYTFQSLHHFVESAGLTHNKAETSKKAYKMRIESLQRLTKGQIIILNEITGLISEASVSSFNEGLTKDKFSNEFLKALQSEK